MKKIQFGLLAVVFLAVPLLQGCEVRFGRGYGDGRGRDNDGRGGWHRHPSETSLANTSDTTAFSLAYDYGISPSSAAKIANLAESQDKKKALSVVGMTEQEMAPIGELKLPSRDAISKLAHNLGEDSAVVEHIFSDFITEVKAE